MTNGLELSLALLVLVATLAVAVARPPYVSEAVAAVAGAVFLVVVGAIGLAGATDALRDLGPTVGFLTAMLLIADGGRREGLFDAMGAVMARSSGGSPQRLLAFVIVIAAAITAVLSLDATIVLLTPVVFAAAARMRTSAKPHVYACAHLANSASLLLPVSNLTNLLAFHASKLSFLRFAALMALPTIAAVSVEWVVFRRFFAVELERPRHVGTRPARPEWPRFAVAVLALTLAGSALSSVVGIEPVWFAVAGAVAMTIPALLRRAATPVQLARAAEPGFLIFVLGLGVIVQAASGNGLDTAVRAVLPAGGSLPDSSTRAGGVLNARSSPQLSAWTSSSSLATVTARGSDRAALAPRRASSSTTLPAAYCCSGPTPRPSSRRSRRRHHPEPLRLTPRQAAGSRRPLNSAPGRDHKRP